MSLSNIRKLSNNIFIECVRAKTYKNPWDKVFNSIPDKLEYSPVVNLGFSKDKGLVGSTI